MTYIPLTLLVTSKCQILPTLKETGSHEGDNRIYICTYKEIYFEKLTHAILGAGKSEIYRAERTDRLATQAGADAAVLRQNFLFSGKLQFYF